MVHEMYAPSVKAGEQLDLKRILHEARTIVVLGASDRPTRTSFAITRYLISEGYEVLPVNPNYRSVLGRPCFPDLASIPADAQVDVINVFRNARYTESVLREIEAFVARTGSRPVVWTQIGVSTPAAADLAEELGLPYVANRCIMVEHSRYF